MEDYMHYINNEYLKGVDGQDDEMYYYFSYQSQYEMHITLGECLAFINGVLETHLPKLTLDDLQDQRVSYSIARYLRENIYRTVGDFDTEAFLTGEAVDWDYWKKCLRFDRGFMPVQEAAIPCDYIIQDIYVYGRDGVGGNKSNFDENVIEELWNNFDNYDHMRLVIDGEYKKRTGLLTSKINIVKIGIWDDKGGAYPVQMKTNMQLHHVNYVNLSIEDLCSSYDVDEELAEDIKSSAKNFDDTYSVDAPDYVIDIYRLYLIQLGGWSTNKEVGADISGLFLSLDHIEVASESELLKDCYNNGVRH